MKCNFCSVDSKEWDKQLKAHLVVTIDKDDHVHVHGPMDNKKALRPMLATAMEEIDFTPNKQMLEQKEIVFSNKMRIGDALMFTCAIRDFKKAFPDVRINVISTAMHIFDNNPYIDNTLHPNEKNIINIGPGFLTNASNRLDWHFANADRISIENALGIHIPQGESRPDIWFTEEEYNAPRIMTEPYWIICIGGEKGWGLKMYPFEKWQEFVNQNPDVKFVQIGTREDNHPRLQGNNVIDYIGKTQDHDTGIRDLFKLFLNAEGSISLVSFAMHLSGGLYKPSIVVAGAREPVAFTRYQGSQYISTEGCLPCATTKACWHCAIDACKNLVIKNDVKIPRCVDMIEPEDLTRALNQYYIGGRLKKGVVSDKPKLKNIVKEQIIASYQTPITNKYNTPFGGSSITDKDYEFIKSVIEKHKVKNVLEFGAGLSTLLISDLVKTVTYETDEKWIKETKSKKDCDIRLWDGKSVDVSDKYDLAFVDGPCGGASREFSTKIASEHADIVIIHDAGRENERKWQDKYLKDKFDGPGKGGHRCHLWIKKSVTTLLSERVETVAVVENKPVFDKKYIKFVFNGRGEGGAERSATWMMNKLTEMGHVVTYNTPSHACGTFVKEGNKNIRVDGCGSLNEACDILVLYTNDWVWDFSKPEICDMFDNINASRKVMCVNYKIGKVGELPWTKSWDNYLFLNSSFEKSLLDRSPNEKTRVLAPPTELGKYFEIKQDYSNGLRLIRHSSQGNAKFPKNFDEIVQKVLASRNDVSLHLMPAPDFMGNYEKVIKHGKNQPSIEEYLKLGNCFWYKLPDDGYSEGGPRVLLECQAAGLAVIADNHSGMKDRVVKGTGWLCNSVEDHINIIKNVTNKELEEFGNNAREHARKEYDPMNWIKEILQ